MKNPKSFGLTTIEPLYVELTNAFTSGTVDEAVVYEKTRENIELRIPMELTLDPMQEKGLELIVPGESRIGGIVVRYPLAFLFFTGIYRGVTPKGAPTPLAGVPRWGKSSIP